MPPPSPSMTPVQWSYSHGVSSSKHRQRRFHSMASHHRNIDNNDPTSWRFIIEIQTTAIPHPPPPASHHQNIDNNDPTIMASHHRYIDKQSYFLLPLLTLSIRFSSAIFRTCFNILFCISLSLSLSSSSPPLLSVYSVRNRASAGKVASCFNQIFYVLFRFLDSTSFIRSMRVSVAGKTATYRLWGIVGIKKNSYSDKL